MLSDIGKSFNTFVPTQVIGNAWITIRLLCNTLRKACAIGNGSIVDIGNVGALGTRSELGRRSLFELGASHSPMRPLADGAPPPNKYLKPEGSKSVYDKRAKQDL